jgi:trans-aconitate 2-methyltransferase
VTAPLFPERPALQKAKSLSETDWNAAAYDNLSEPQFAWGMAVLESAPLEGSDRVLDAGCGSGRLTEVMLERLPSGTLVALDSSPQMLAQARERLGRFGARVEFLQASLDDFSLARPVDGIFSNAVFHWVPDRSAMFRCLHAALRPGGWLVAQFGGVGNLERTHNRALEAGAQAQFRDYLGDVLDYGAHFENPENTRQRMVAAGFRVSHAGLHSVMARFERRDRFEAFLHTVVLRRPLARLPEALRSDFLREVSARTLREEGCYVLDYVRLTVRATA